MVVVFSTRTEQPANRKSSQPVPPAQRGPGRLATGVMFIAEGALLVAASGSF